MMKNEKKIITQKDIKFIRSLRLKKNRYFHKKFIVEGEKNVSALLNSHFVIHKIFASKNRINENLLNNKVVYVSDSKMKQISNLKTPSKVFAIVNMNRDTCFKNQKKILLLDNIKDPGNLGNIIRSSNWFGVDIIVLSKNCVDIYNEKVIQSSMGSLFDIDFIYCDLIDFISKLKNIPIIVTTLEGDQINSVNKFDSFALVVGNESEGINKKLISLSNYNFKISKKTKKIDSLNVASATSIFLYLITR